MKALDFIIAVVEKAKAYDINQDSIFTAAFEASQCFRFRSVQFSFDIEKA